MMTFRASFDVRRSTLRSTRRSMLLLRAHSSATSTVSTVVEESLRITVRLGIRSWSIAVPRASSVWRIPRPSLYDGIPNEILVECNL
jgi:hypothetical protein